jgi:hypothetical protein
MTGIDYTLFTHKSAPVIFEAPCTYMVCPLKRVGGKRACRLVAGTQDIALHVVAE